jgi:hypothetical protein
LRTFILEPFVNFINALFTKCYKMFSLLVHKHKMRSANADLFLIGHFLEQKQIAIFPSLFIQYGIHFIALFKKNTKYKYYYVAFFHMFQRFTLILMHNYLFKRRKRKFA